MAASFAATFVSVRAAAFDVTRGRAGDTKTVPSKFPRKSRQNSKPRNVRVGVIDPVSLMVGGAMVTAGRALLARNEQNSSDSERDGSGKIANGSAFDVDVTTGSDSTHLLRCVRRRRHWRAKHNRGGRDDRRVVGRFGERA
jgi:hypothetical protein